MESLLAIATGVALATVLGCGVRSLLDIAAPKPRAPEPFSCEQWAQLIESSGGPWIGALERYLSFAAFWTGNPTVILGWLTFKLAAKWEAWKNVVQVPSALAQVDELKWFVIRRVLSAHLLSRFLIGTLVNVLIGWFCSFIGRRTMHGFMLLLFILRPES